MSCITEDQPLKLTATITANSAALTNQLTAAEFQYYANGNYTDTPTGTWEATILDANTGTIEYNIPENILKSGIWRVQTFGTTGGLKFPACAQQLTVYDKGVIL